MTRRPSPSPPTTTTAGRSRSNSPTILNALFALSLIHGTDFDSMPTPPKQCRHRPQARPDEPGVAEDGVPSMMMVPVC